MEPKLRKLTSETVKNNLQKIDVNESYFKYVKEDLSSVVFGQEEACEAVARIVTRFEAGLSGPNEPAGVVFFLGPTGVGKTEMSRALAKQMFNDAHTSQLKIINCAEFADSFSVYRFLGTPPGYVGYGDETIINQEFLDRRNIIVFDEIEKADPALWKMLLSVFDTGRLQIRGNQENGSYKSTEEIELDFQNSFIILTSNVGAEEMQSSGKTLGFLSQPKYQGITQAAMTGLHNCFGKMPEFLGRIDEFVIFKPLTDEHYEKIYWKFIEEINDNIQTGTFFTTTVELTQYLIKEAVKDKQYGARNMHHVIKTKLLHPLSDVLATSQSKDVLVGDLEGEEEFYQKSIQG